MATPTVGASSTDSALGLAAAPIVSSNHDIPAVPLHEAGDQVGGHADGDGKADARAVEEGYAAVQPCEAALHADKRAVVEEEGEKHGSRRSMVLACSLFAHIRQMSISGCLIARELVLLLEPHQPQATACLSVEM